MTKKKEPTSIKFLGEPASLMAIENFAEVAKRLERFQTDTNKALAKLADEHGVQLKVDMFFDLKPKTSGGA